MTQQKMPRLGQSRLRQLRHQLVQQLTLHAACVL
jgi:hypothetical protein